MSDVPYGAAFRRFGFVHHLGIGQKFSSKRIESEDTKMPGGRNCTLLGLEGSPDLAAAKSF